MLRPACTALVARLRPRHDFHQQAADAHAGDVVARSPAGRHSSRISTQSKPFSLGLRAQPGAPSTGRPPAAPISIRLPGSTGMPKCSIVPPTASTAAGMTSRRSAMAEAPNTMTSSAPCLEDLVERTSERRGLVRHAPLGDDRGARRRQPLGGDPQRLLDHLVGEARQHRRDDADLADLVGRDPHQRRARTPPRAPRRAPRRRPRTE